MTIARDLSFKDEDRILEQLNRTRYPIRNKAICLLTIKAGLRVVEISGLKWSYVLTPTHEIREWLYIPSSITKRPPSNKKEGRQPTAKSREVPVNDALKEALIAHYKESFTTIDKHVFINERKQPLTRNYLAILFHTHYRKAGMFEYSSHSGRRTFITRAARNLDGTGTSLYDVQRMAGHTSLETTQKYIVSNLEGQKILVNRI